MACRRRLPRVAEATPAARCRRLRPVGDLADATCNPADTDEFTGYIGIPVPTTDDAIHDDDGKGLPPGELGEIAPRPAGDGRLLEQAGRDRQPDRGRLLRTGDIGVMDERGYFKIVDRKKDMINGSRASRSGRARSRT